MAKPNFPGAEAVSWWAHRGTMVHENTWRGIQAALDAGADGVELDVQVSSDGVPFLFHDDTLDRLAAGTAREWGRARALSWSELQRVQVCGSEPIPSLASVLERWPQDRILNLELKRGGESLITAIEGLIVGRENVVLSSFNPGRLRSAARLGHPRGLLLERVSKPWLHASGAVDLGCEWVHLEACLVAEWLIERYAQAGIGVAVWGAESPAREQELAAMGVRRIITDFIA